jgi:hypothetical protein
MSFVDPAGAYDVFHPQALRGHWAGKLKPRGNLVVLLMTTESKFA